MPARAPFPLVTVLIVAVGAAVGAVARHAVELALPVPAVALSVINLSGSLVLGVLFGVVLSEGRQRGARTHRVYQLLGPGFLGGYTTFSTLMVQVITHVTVGGLVLLISQLVVGPLLALAGIWLGERVRV